MDSFKRLLDEEDDFAMPEQTMRDIEKRIHSATQPVRFAVNTVDLFVPKAIDAMMAIFGSRNVRKKEQKIAPPSHHSDPANGGF